MKDVYFTASKYKYISHKNFKLFLKSQYAYMVVHYKLVFKKSRNHRARFRSKVKRTFILPWVYLEGDILMCAIPSI